jgi:hypothetical protein
MCLGFIFHCFAYLPFKQHSVSWFKTDNFVLLHKVVLIWRDLADCMIWGILLGTNYIHVQYPHILLSIIQNNEEPKELIWFAALIHNLVMTATSTEQWAGNDIVALSGRSDVTFIVFHRVVHQRHLLPLFSCWFLIGIRVPQLVATGWPNKNIPTMPLGTRSSNDYYTEPCSHVPHRDIFIGLPCTWGLFQSSGDREMLLFVLK